MQYYETRMYSIREMKEMLRTELSDDFLKYIQKAPDSIVNILLSWSDEQKTKEVIEQIKQERTVVQKAPDVGASDIEEVKQLSFQDLTDDWECEFDDAILVDDEFEEFEAPDLYEIVTSKLEVESLENPEGSAETVNPYEKLLFQYRLDVSELYIHLLESDTCPIHHTALATHQVVANYGNGKKYGMVAMGCDQCKKIFMRKLDWDDLEPRIQKKGIKYTIIEGEM